MKYNNVPFVAAERGEENMSYYAWGSGEAKLKEGVDTEKLRENLSKLDTLDFNIIGSIIEFCDSENYYEAEVLKFLESLSPYITEGKIVYSGDEDLHWRFVFNPKNRKWNEESGVVDYNMESYSEEEIIKKAISLGYIMYKPIDIKGRYASKVRSVERLNDETPDGYIRDADTILKDLLDANDFEISGIAQDIFNIYKESRDKKSVEQMFFEFTGVEFSEYLDKCVKEITRERTNLYDCFVLNHPIARSGSGTSYLEIFEEWLSKDKKSIKDVKGRKTEILKRIKPYKDFSLCRDLIAFGVGECFLSEEYAGFDEAVVAVEKEWLFNLLKDKGIENPLDFLQHEYTWYDSAEWFENAAKEGKVVAIEFID